MKQIKLPLLKSFLTLVFVSIIRLSNAQNIDEGFKNPPESAKPRTWWHWTNSNITKEGITKDLEWMKRSGIGGMQLADVASGQGQVVENKILFGSPEWYDAVKHAASEADRLNLEMTVFSSPGWSLTGGPWVKPEQAMKKLVWSEINIKGPLSFSGILPPPPSNEGLIRNMTRAARPSATDPQFYKDCIVLAFPTPADESSDKSIIPVIKTSGGVINEKALLDDDLNSFAIIRSGKDKNIVWIQFEYEKPFCARALTIASRNGIPVGTLSAGNDGVNFRTVITFPGPQLYRAGKVETVSFPETTGKYFRIEFNGAPMKPADVMAENTTRPDTLYTINELILHSGARTNRWEDKAGFYHLFNYEPVASPDVPATAVIDPSKITDLTSLMLPDGTIKWKVPEGQWTIMRFGYSLTGSKNRPAVPSGSGYEVDKLSTEHSEAYIKGYMGKIKEALGPLYGKSLQYVLLDSWEAGMQNWTDEMIPEFKKRRGYDPVPFIPCLAGRVIGSSEISDRFLWDFRRTLADMFAENHYAVITEYLHKQGIKTYGEASGVSLEILEDALLCKKYVDIPMGEFWYRALHPELMYYQDVRGAASASHIYGKNLVAAESFTGGGFESPRTLKKIGDYWFTQGINRFVFHTSAHQPLDTKPGNTMVGTHINRNITWAEEAAPFMKYLARNSFMLQQGRFAADLVYLLDEGAPSTMPIWGPGLIPAPPEGFDYDYINADALLTRMTVSDDGKLMLPDGMCYSILVLPNTNKMTLPVLKKIHELVQSGATVVGPRPENSPGLSGFPDSENKIKDLVSELWGDLDGISRTKRLSGKGKIYWSSSIDKILAMSGIVPDIEYVKPLDAKLNWIHRRTDNTDIYFLVNSADKEFITEIRFRVTGMEAELWDPASGIIRPLSYKITGDRTIVPLRLLANESAFVVFRNKTNDTERTISEKVPRVIAELKGPWEISFSPWMGAPSVINTDTLKSWTTSKEEGIKYYSGSAEYSTTLEVPKKWIGQDSKLILDLGQVGDLAEVTINGINAGIIWKYPYRVDISGLLRKGQNKLQIRVINQWTNRLAGDQKAGNGKKVLNSPLFIPPRRNLDDSGLMGPVTLLKE